jgi:hypothetical protein
VNDTHGSNSVLPRKPAPSHRGRTADDIEELTALDLAISGNRRDALAGLSDGGQEDLPAPRTC